VAPRRGDEGLGYPRVTGKAEVVVAAEVDAVAAIDVHACRPRHTRLDDSSRSVTLRGADLFERRGEICVETARGATLS
jgi:hypothetical protein